jgi:hypothetical protein
MHDATKVLPIPAIARRGDGWSALVVVYRKALAKQFMEKLAPFGFMHYNDGETFFTTSAWCARSRAGSIIAQHEAKCSFFPKSNGTFNGHTATQTILIVRRVAGSVIAQHEAKCSLFGKIIAKVILIDRKDYARRLVVRRVAGSVVAQHEAKCSLFGTWGP